jgi:16S rRNA (uracil1498-N3)-methyltransferase
MGIQIMAHRYRFFGDMCSPESYEQKGRAWTSSLGTSDSQDNKGVLWRLLEDECHHGLKTLRLETGAIVEVTDGKGHWSFGELEVIHKNLCYVHAQLPPAEPNATFTENALEHVHLGRGLNQEIEPSQAMGLLLGALRPGEVDELLPPLTELGVSSINIFAQKGTPSWAQKSSVVERWERLIAQALKQCKRSYIPKIHLSGSLSQALELFLAPCGSDLVSARKYVLSELAPVNLLDTLDKISLTKSGVILACGSERGFEQEEIHILHQSGFEQVCLGGGILRAKTAVLLGAGILCLKFQAGRT